MNKEISRTSGPPEILMVEDSVTQADRLAEVLKRDGYRVRVAHDGEAGLLAARASRPTLIISDINMPVMDGFAMCRELRKDPVLRDVPIILLTSLTSLYDVINGLECGADNFIRKPFDEKYLLNRIRLILANRELRHKETVQFGMRVALGGRTHLVTAERQQILDLLISTYEEAILMNEELRSQQEEIARSYQKLEGLYRIAESLNPATSLRTVVAVAMERALDLPNVAGARMLIANQDGSNQCICSQDFDAATDDDADCREWIGADPSGDDPDQRMIRVPMTAGERNLGMIELLCHGDEDELAEQQHVYQALGNQTSVAVERAMLYTHMEELVRQRTEALESERTLLSAVMDNSDALILMIDPQGRIETFNPACERAFGWKMETVRGRPYREFMAEEDYTAERSFQTALTETGQPRQQLIKFVARDGSLRDVVWSATAVRKADGSLDYFVCSGLDVTELRKAEERVSFLSNFDLVTGLPNRTLLRDRFDGIRDNAIRDGKALGFLMIHFARLAELRQTRGLQAEAALLGQIAGRLRNWAGSEEHLARFDEDSFVVLIVSDGPAELSAAAKELIALFDKPFEFALDLQLAAHIGIALVPDDGDDLDDIALAAATAMRSTLERKTERYTFYHAEFNRIVNERFRLESDLRRALDQQEFVLYYQPQVDAMTGKLVGLEALIRWQHPRDGLVGPAHFIPLAEELGLILPIGEWVMQEACRQNAEWQKAGFPVVPIHVNLSAKQFASDVVGSVQEALIASGLTAGLMALELTESVSMGSPQRTIQVLNKLRDIGVHTAIDDFGTGYSNLAYLKKFPVDRLKLDRSFVRDLSSGSDDLSISRAVIEMAHSLQLKVTAEGVETEEQLSLLRAAGCDEIQGYLISPPVPGADAGRWFEGSTLM